MNYSLVTLRILTGWYFFYAGFSKLINPSWSASGYLMNAKTAPELYAWFARPDLLPITNALNEWGLTLLGASLLLGIGLRISTWLGSALMLLYYIPVLQFPIADGKGFLVDTHIIFIAVLTLLRSSGSDQWVSIKKHILRIPLVRRYSWIITLCK